MTNAENITARIHEIEIALISATGATRNALQRELRNLRSSLEAPAAPAGPRLYMQVSTGRVHRKSSCGMRATTRYANRAIDTPLADVPTGALCARCCSSIIAERDAARRAAQAPAAARERLATQAADLEAIAEAREAVLEAERALQGTVRAAAENGLSHRTIAKAAGITHPTVAKLLR